MNCSRTFSLYDLRFGGIDAVFGQDHFADAVCLDPPLMRIFDGYDMTLHVRPDIAVFDFKVAVFHTADVKFQHAAFTDRLRDVYVVAD